MDKYIITFSDKELVSVQDYEKIIVTFNNFLSGESDNVIVIHKEIFNSLEIYKVDLVDNSIKKMRIKDG